jgi:serine/threonine protein kinase
MKVNAAHARHGSRDSVAYEARVLDELRGGGTLIPRLYWSGKILVDGVPRSAFAMNRMGVDLAHVLLKYPEGLSGMQVNALSGGIIDALEHAHGKGVLHRDIKPANIMLGGAEQSSVTLTDWGLAKKFIGDDQKHIAWSSKKASMTGTPRYASAWVHRGCQSARRDDIASTLYTVLSLRGQPLPWSNDHPTNAGREKKLTRQEIGALKSAVSGGELCGIHFPALSTWERHLRSMKFSQSPSYNLIRAALAKMATQKYGN